MQIAVMKHEGAVAVRVGSEAAVTVQQSAESQRAEIGNGVLRISIGDLLPDSGVTLGVSLSPVTPHQTDREQNGSM